MGAAAAAWESSPQFKSGDLSVDDLYQVLRGMVDAYYKNTQALVLDKSRGWPNPKIMATMGRVQDHPPKIVATVRPVAECLASFIKISKWDKSPREFINSPLAQHLFFSFATLKDGYEQYTKSFLFVEYADLVSNPQHECDRVADFLELPRFKHRLDGLSNPVPENDAKTWGIPDLHFVRPDIERADYSAKDVLGDKLWNFYQGGEFWTGKQDPVPDKGTLDLQLEAGLHGDFEKGWQYCQLAAEDDIRAQFNKGWYLLMRGELRKGLALIDRGREERFIGHARRSSMPLWHGQRLNGETVLLQGENGFGDQIIHARFAKDIAERGGKVVLACHASLAPVLATIKGISAVVQWRAAGGVFHHHYVPAMSAALALGYEYGDLDGLPYVHWPSSFKRSDDRIRVGICWRGDPHMMHDEYRRFDPQPLFDLDGVELVSLQQKWDGDIPAHVKRPTLDSWEKTATVISGLDLSDNVLHWSRPSRSGDGQAHMGTHTNLVLLYMGAAWIGYALVQ